MKKYFVCANVIYGDIFEADSPEEAAELFECDCPYDIDGTIVVTDRKTDETYEF